MGRVTLTRVRDVKTDSPAAVKDAFERIQNATADAFSAIYSSGPIADGRLVAFINGADDSASGPTLEGNRRSGTIALKLAPDLKPTVLAIPHGLGRPYRGWIVVRKSAAADVYEAYKPNAPELRGDLDPSRVVVLLASQPVTVTLWVF